MGRPELTQRQRPHPGCSPRPLPNDPWLPPPAPVVRFLEPAQASWLSHSPRQISFSKAAPSVWMTASGSYQLDILFIFSVEPLMLPSVPISWEVLGTGGTLPLVRDHKCRPREATQGETSHVLPSVRHTQGGMRAWKQAGADSQLTGPVERKLSEARSVSRLPSPKDWFLATGGQTWT